MIFDYYCVDCGAKKKGEDIFFDVAELLGLQGMNGAIRTRASQISVAQLKTMARKSNVALSHDKKVRICITLLEFLELMAERQKEDDENSYAGALQRQMEDFGYSQLDEILDQLDVFNSTENPEVARDQTKSLGDALRSRFYPEGSVDSLSEEDREDLDLYRAYFWIQPEFFEDGASEHLYTLKYSDNPKQQTYKKIICPSEIRGYCPNCGKPVLMGAGKYEHVLIGLLGAQSAGKTSTIVALLKEIEKVYKKYGVKYPGSALCDSKYNHRILNTTLYERGWAVVKTDKDTNIATFNASLLVQQESGEGHAKILTFIDIAGEQCYNLDLRTVNTEAFEVYPLINSCDVYLLCTCIDMDGYGNAAGEKANIPLDAVLEIARGIYNNLRYPSKIPPMCIVMTKADLAPEDMQPNTDPDPFDGLIMNSEFLYRKQIQDLHQIYEQYDQENIQEPLRWCVNTYEDMVKITYMSMIAVSALGRTASAYEGSEKDIPMSPEGPFRRQNMDILWNWLLQTLGMTVINDGEEMGYLPYVPSYKEAYAEDESRRDGQCIPRRVFTAEESRKRINAVRALFMNLSEQDQDILSIWASEEGGGWFGRRNPEALHKRKIEDILRIFE